jgi:hypothetical protein
MPVMMPAPGAALSYRSSAASGASLEERRVGVQQHLDALARQQLAARGVLGACGLAAALRDLLEPGAQVAHQLAHQRARGLARGP